MESCCIHQIRGHYQHNLISWLVWPLKARKRTLTVYLKSLKFMENAMKFGVGLWEDEKNCLKMIQFAKIKTKKDNFESRKKIFLETFSNLIFITLSNDIKKLYFTVQILLMSAISPRMKKFLFYGLVSSNNYFQDFEPK